MRYLSTAETIAAMPVLSDQLMLADAALTAIEEGAQVPGKVAIYPAPDSSIAYAMPASFTAPVAGVAPAFGMKWVTVFPGSTALGLPPVSGLIVLNDPATLAITAIMEATAITAARTAAVSGSILSHLAPSSSGRPQRIGLVGAGSQGMAHVPILGHVAPGLELTVHDRNPKRALEVAQRARGTVGIGSVRVVDSAAAAADGADVLITAVSFGPRRQLLQPEWLMPNALMIAVDYEMHASAELAQSASAFLIDDRSGLENSRREGRFAGFPEPTSTLGAFYLSRAPRPAGRVLAVHLGTGLTDVIFAAAIAARARSLGLGIELRDPGRLG